MGTAAVVAVGGLAAGATAMLASPGAVADGPVLCPFRRLTGLPCPACGLTRSWVALGHGDLPAAFGDNAFGPLFLLVAAVTTVVALTVLVTGGGGLRRLQEILTGRIALGVLGLWLGYGIVRAVSAAYGWGLFPTVT